MNTTIIARAGVHIEAGDLVAISEKDGRAYPFEKATTSQKLESSTGMAAELLRDIQQRNYGAAETKARQLWNQLGREAQAMRKACNRIKATLDETERKIHQQRVAAAGQAGSEVAARLEARRLAEPNHKERDIFLQEMDYRISNLNNAHPQTQHREGMRAGFMLARAIYKGTRK